MTPETNLKDSLGLVVMLYRPNKARMFDCELLDNNLTWTFSYERRYPSTCTTVQSQQVGKTNRRLEKKQFTSYVCPSRHLYHAH